MEPAREQIELMPVPEHIEELVALIDKARRDVAAIVGLKSLTQISEQGETK